MARHKTRRGGAWYDPRSWFAKSPEQKAKECADARKKADEVCAGEASAPAAAPAASASAEMAGAPASTEQTAAARRRRRATRRRSRKMRGGAKSLKVTVVGTSSDDLSGNEIEDLQAAINHQYRAKTKGYYTVSVEGDDLVLTYADQDGESADVPAVVPQGKEVTLSHSKLAKHLKTVKFSA